MGGGGGQTKPAPENRFATGALTGYLLGPVDLGDSRATEGAAMFGNGAGSGVGILPDWNEVTDLSDNTFFGNMTGPDANPMLTDAYGRIFDAPKITIGGGGGGGFGAGFGAGAGQVGDIDLDQFGPDLIPASSVANAVNYLENTPSVFDVMSGGPIVDTINQRVEAEDQAYTTRAMEDLEQATEIAFSNDMAQGLLSGSTILLNRQRLTEGVLNDLNAFRATRSLESTKYLGDLAMQDVINQSNNMQAIIQQALIEKGIKVDAATAIAVAEAANAKDLAVAQLNASTQRSIAQGEIDARLAINQQNNALAMLGMGMDDYNTATNRQLNTALTPLTLLAGQGGGGSITNQPKSV